ncbi:heat shock protein DnaJ family protein [Tieghemostelium lacteum]|uniref:Heat shock protein DnaJ family protein n=1 Tax=Tieghemostelium lacteum TaxID=361077 RepID=A0A151ZBE7_TIELA|nr:heat shock protein DnaJ family protein [Tieghemostelium lacteum]|eukprot:KYQ91272.1 heat shock protein DnaJ family protein [Tieghemostelium lacteum]
MVTFILFEEKRDLYEVLGVPRSATKQEIKTAFYDLAKKYHPDANRDDPNASKKFAEISNAYDILYDENKRAMYDARGHQGATMENGYPGAGGAGFHPNDINLEDLFGGINIEDLFGGGGGRGRQSQGGVGEDIQVHVHLDFMEAINGVDKDISFHGGSKCGTCDGSGAKPGTKPQTCKTCNGTGSQVKSNGFFQMQSTCRTCKGSGKTIKDSCGTCKGKGITEGMRTLSVKIPPGVNNGTNIKLTGQGEPAPGKNSRKGNLYISVTVSEHELFKRQGNDIHLDVPITLSQAILGATVSIPTLTGEVDLKVPAGTQPGEKRVLKGKGVRSVNNVDYGNQYVHFIVSIPKSISSKQEKLIKEFEEEDKTNNGPIDSLSHPVLSFWNKSMKKWRDYLSKLK